MSRSLPASLVLAVVVLSQTAALAAHTFIQPSSRRPAPANPSQRGSGSLPQTSQLDNELQQTLQSLNSLAAKIGRTEKSAESARKAAQDVEAMIRLLGKLDSKVKRIKRELDSLTKIPQLRMLKPLAKSLGNIHKEIHSLRKKADRANRDHVKPMIKRLKGVERKLEKKLAEVRQVASQTRQARQKLAELRSFVTGRGYRRHEVAALEAAARPVRSTIHPLRQMISKLDRSLSGIDRDFNGLAQKLSGVASAKRSLSKLDRDLAKADKVARDLNKVMSKKLSIKFPVKVSVSVRQILEAPGKLIDVVVKPLTKLAEKALKPILGKVKVKVGLPRELKSLSGQLNKLKSMNAGLQSPISKVDNALRVQVPQNYRQQIGRLLSKSTSQLTR